MTLLNPLSPSRMSVNAERSSSRHRLSLAGAISSLGFHVHKALLRLELFVSADRLSVSFNPLEPFALANFLDQQVKSSATEVPIGYKRDYLIIEEIDNRNIVIEDIIKWAQEVLDVTLVNSEQSTTFAEIAAQEWRKHIDSTEGLVLGKLVAQIFTHKHKELSQAFIHLLQQKFTKDENGYQNTVVDHVVAGGWIQFGDFGDSELLESTNISIDQLVQHTQRGQISLLNSNLISTVTDLPHLLLTDGNSSPSNSTIFLSLAPLPDFDTNQQYVVIGQVVDGWDTVNALESLLVDKTQRVKDAVIVSKCGLLYNSEEVIVATSPIHSPVTRKQSRKEPLEEFLLSTLQSDKNLNKSLKLDQIPLELTSSTTISSTTTTKHDSLPTNSVNETSTIGLPSPPKQVVSSTFTIAVGDQVTVIGNKNITGTARYVGEASFREGIWVGIELTVKGTGKNDGSVANISYFTCAPRTGVFVPLDKVVLLSPSPSILQRNKPSVSISIEHSATLLPKSYPSGKPETSNQDISSTTITRLSLKSKRTLERTNVPTTADIQLSTAQQSNRIGRRSEKRHNVSMSAPTPANSLDNLRQRTHSSLLSKPDKNITTLKHTDSDSKLKPTTTVVTTTTPLSSNRIGTLSKLPGSLRKDNIDNSKLSSSITRRSLSARKPVSMTPAVAPVSTVVSLAIHQTSTSAPERSRAVTSASSKSDNRMPSSVKTQKQIATTIQVGSKQAGLKRPSDSELSPTASLRPDTSHRPRSSTAPSDIRSVEHPTSRNTPPTTYVTNSPRTPSANSTATTPTGTSSNNDVILRKLQTHNELLEAENNYIKVELAQERASMKVTKMNEIKLSNQISLLLSEQKQIENNNLKMQLLTTKLTQFERDNIELQDTVEQSQKEMDAENDHLRAEIAHLQAQIKEKDAATVTLTTELQTKSTNKIDRGAQEPQQLERLYKDLDELTFALKSAQNVSRGLETQLMQKQNGLIEIDKKLADSQQVVEFLTDKLQELERYQSLDIQTMTTRISTLVEAEQKLTTELQQAQRSRRTCTVENEELHSEVDRLMKTNEELKKATSVEGRTAVNKERVVALEIQIKRLETQLAETVKSKQNSSRQHEEEFVRLLNDKKKAEAVYETQLANGEQKLQKYKSREIEFTEQIKDAQRQIEAAKQDASSVFEKAKAESLQQMEERITNSENIAKLKEFELKEVQHWLQQTKSELQTVRQENGVIIRRLSSELEAAREHIKEIEVKAQNLADELIKIRQKFVVSTSADVELQNYRDAQEKMLEKAQQDALIARNQLENEWKEKMTKAHTETSNLLLERDSLREELHAVKSERNKFAIAKPATNNNISNEPAPSTSPSDSLQTPTKNIQQESPCDQQPLAQTETELPTTQNVPKLIPVENDQIESILKSSEHVLIDTHHQQPAIALYTNVVASSNSNETENLNSDLRSLRSNVDDSTIVEERLLHVV